MSGRSWIPSAVVVAFAAAVALEATTFDVTFPTDPLGPKAFPLVAAALIALGGIALLIGGALGGGAEHRVAEAPLPGPAGRRLALATASFLLYALILDPVGFVPATTLEFAALSVLFGGPVLRGGLAGLVFAVAVYGLFVSALGLPLPIGVLER